MSRWVACAGLLALAGGCGSVTQVRGWAGGPVSAGVEGGNAVVSYTAPQPGWTLTVDRGRIDGDTAILWLTAEGSTEGPEDRTVTTATWAPPDGGHFRCVQAHIRLIAPAITQRAYRPAAVGCTELN
ncbi:MAG: hypothetical protein QF733_05220 [Phycisphaerales bacterium]|jgi:hypothetical protein|nr:hypothetical protein [Phycisphaerales bacterium]